MRTLSLANGFLSSVSDLVAQGIEGSVSPLPTFLISSPTTPSAGVSLTSDPFQLSPRACR